MITGYEAAVAAAAAATNLAQAELRGNGTRRAKVRELGAFSSSAVAATYGIGRPQAAGVGNGTNQALGQAQDPADAVGTANWHTITWATTAPTIPLVFVRRFEFNNVIGSGSIFTWPSDGELIIPLTVPSLVFWNLGAGTSPTSDFYAVWAE